jgi:hypothetical protein
MPALRYFSDCFRSCNTPLATACVEAIQSSIAACTPGFKHLPAPVRYRATGAARAWEAVRNAAGDRGRVLSRLLADNDTPPLSLLPQQIELTEYCDVLDPLAPDSALVKDASRLCAYWLAFWSRGGALYEPTTALHKLLESTDVAQDVPVELLRPPVPALCIVPPPQVWTGRDGFEAMLVFEHAPPPSSSQRCLTFVVAGDGRTDAFATDLVGPKTVAQALDASYRSIQCCGEMPDLTLMRQRWMQRLLYAAKVLLYLKLDNAHVSSERPYSHAPKAFPGLGRRKREIRLAEIEQLYDRYLVGPPVLPEEVEGAAGGGNGHGVAAHWRRGHFRMQPHGAQGALRKLIFVAPVLVRADKLAEVSAS